MVVSGSLLYSITPSGTVTTLGSGNPLAPGTLVGLAYDPAAAVYLTCDWRNNTLYSVTPAGVATALLAGAPLSMPEAVVVIPSPASLPAPTITSAISASGFGAFSSVAPGSWIEIYGNNFSLNAPRLWTGADFVGNTAPTQLSGVQVKIGGQNAFVEYVSDQQINAQVPAIGTGASQITVTTAWGASAPYNIVVNPTEAGLLAPPSFQIGGKQYVVAQHLDGTYVLPPGAISGVSSSQAKPGETIVIYGVGFGQVTPGIGEGQIEPGQSQLASQFQMVFGTTQAQVTYDGLAPGLVGLYQFNVVVPQIANSDLVPLGFTLAGGSGAQTLYSAVHQ